MAQKPLEVILMRQLASTLAMPIFLVDADGTLVYYNELAERVLGMRFEETGEMPASEWATVWSPTNGDGRALAAEELPLTIAANEGRPAHGDLWIKSLDGHRRHIEATAFPLLRAPGDVVGAVAIFWEIP